MQRTGCLVAPSSRARRTLTNPVHKQGTRSDRVASLGSCDWSSSKGGACGFAVTALAFGRRKTLAARRVHKLGDLPSCRPRVLMNEPAEPVTAADRDLVSRGERSHLWRGLRGAQPKRSVWALAVVVVDVFA